MPHAIGIPALTKSCFGKNQSYEVLTHDRRYDNLLVPGQVEIFFYNFHIPVFYQALSYR